MSMRKIYIIPNLVTSANLFSGFYSIVLSMRGDFDKAAWLILIAAVFDALDGRIARMAKATSAFGVQYDSLSDLVSFGMAPALLLYSWGLEPLGRMGIITAFFYACCGALRLARFNMNTEVVSKAYFQGVASPIAAAAVATFAIFRYETGLPADDSVITLQVITICLSVVLGGLMVSTIPFPSFKELNWRSRSSFGYLLIGLAAMIFIILKPEITLFILVASYIVGSLIWVGYRLATHRPIDLKMKEPVSP